MALDLAKQSRLLGAPLRRHPVLERVVGPVVERADIHGMQATFQPVVLDLAAVDSLLMLPALIGVAGLPSYLYPFQYLFIEMQPVEQTSIRARRRRR